jgi:hypothetical protein
VAAVATNWITALDKMPSTLKNVRIKSDAFAPARMF